MSESPSTTRRLTRSKRDRMLGGVAGGLGEYFGIDAVLVRLVFVVLAFAGGGGILAYLIAWIIIPEASDDAPAAVAQSSASTNSTLAGILLVGIGGLMLIAQLVPAFSWRFVGPAVLIAAGIVLVLRKAEL